MPKRGFVTCCTLITVFLLVLSQVSFALECKTDTQIDIDIEERLAQKGYIFSNDAQKRITIDKIKKEVYVDELSTMLNKISSPVFTTHSINDYKRVLRTFDLESIKLPVRIIKREEAKNIQSITADKLYVLSDLHMPENVLLGIDKVVDKIKSDGNYKKGSAIILNGDFDGITRLKGILKIKEIEDDAKKSGVTVIKIMGNHEFAFINMIEAVKQATKKDSSGKITVDYEEYNKYTTKLYFGELFASQTYVSDYDEKAIERKRIELQTKGMNENEVKSALEEYESTRWLDDTKTFGDIKVDELNIIAEELEDANSDISQAYEYANSFEHAVIANQFLITHFINTMPQDPKTEDIEAVQKVVDSAGVKNIMLGHSSEFLVTSKKGAPNSKINEKTLTHPDGETVANLFSLDVWTKSTGNVALIEADKNGRVEAHYFNADDSEGLKLAESETIKDRIPSAESVVKPMIDAELKDYALLFKQDILKSVGRLTDNLKSKEQFEVTIKPGNDVDITLDFSVTQTFNTELTYFKRDLKELFASKTNPESFLKHIDYDLFIDYVNAKNNGKEVLKDYLSIIEQLINTNTLPDDAKTKYRRFYDDTYGDFKKNKDFISSNNIYTETQSEDFIMGREVPFKVKLKSTALTETTSPGDMIIDTIHDLDPLKNNKGAKKAVFVSYRGIDMLLYQDTDNNWHRAEALQIENTNIKILTPIVESASFVHPVLSAEINKKITAAKTETDENILLNKIRSKNLVVDTNGNYEFDKKSYIDFARYKEFENAKRTDAKLTLKDKINKIKTVQIMKLAQQLASTGKEAQVLTSLVKIQGLEADFINENNLEDSCQGNCFDLLQTVNLLVELGQHDSAREILKTAPPAIMNIEEIFISLDENNLNKALVAIDNAIFSLTQNSIGSDASVKMLDYLLELKDNLKTTIAIDEDILKSIAEELGSC